MEGETKVTDTSVGNRLFRFGCDIKVPQVRPALLVHTVEQVEIDMVRLQTVELFLKIAVEIILGLDQPGRQFGGQFHLVAIPLPQRLSDQGFARTTVIGIGRIQVVDPCIDCAPDHLDGQFLVYPGLVSLNDR